MRQLLQQLEEMHIRIAETATHEETLVKALADALIRLDEQLLQDVQSIATEHEARRGAILGELQGLASSIGMFQVSRPAVTARPDLEPEPASYTPIAGDWREATSKITDDLDTPVNGRAAPRALFPHEQRRATVPLSLTERRRRASGG
jgi:hypothetical protein